MGLRPSSTRRWLAAAVGFVLAATIAAGCSDDDSGTDDPDQSEPAPSSPEPTGSTPGDDVPGDDGPTGDRSPGGDDEPSDEPGSPGHDDGGDDGPSNGQDDGAVDDASGERPQFGAVYHGMWDMTWSDRAELLDKLVATGARWVRIGVQWSALQPRRPTAGDPGWNLEWGVPKADRVIGQAVQRGLAVSVTLLRTPDWANGGGGPERLPTDPATYARTIQWLAHRYRDRVDSWEIYNEPNNPNHLVASVAEYVDLLCAAYPAAHRGDPTTTVVFGGTSGVDYDYIDAAYAQGAKPCFDVLAVHPYNGAYSPLLEARSEHRWWWRNIDLVRQVMRRHDDRSTPVWFTEYGWSSHPNAAGTPSWEEGVSREQQARYAVQLLRITRRDYPYVARVAWYAARDETTSTVENNNFGLFTLDLRPKPVVTALREYLRTG
jgi:polysaccharide biosynthesis protein PslG